MIPEGWPLRFSTHAIRRMFERGLMPSDVRAALESGEMIEEYRDDQPRPSRLVLGRSGETPLHVVAADDTSEQKVIVITVYVPDPQQWGVRT